MRINKKIREYIEFELRHYDQTKQEWEQIRRDIVKEKNAHEDYKVRIGLEQPELCDGPTESKALRAITNARLGQLERTMKAFEMVIPNLPEEKFRLMQLRYWTIPQCLTDEGIAQKLHISRKTYYRYVDGILTAIAKELGLVD
jgi:RinA family phage transcriptional activator